MTCRTSTRVVFTHNVTDEAIGHFQFANGWTASVIPYEAGKSCACLAWPSHGLTPIPGRAELHGTDLSPEQVAEFLVTVSKKEPV